MRASALFIFMITVGNTLSTMDCRQKKYLDVSRLRMRLTFLTDYSIILSWAKRLERS